MNTKEKLHNYFYKITNLVNEKYYYGIHSTDNLDDRYMGGGDAIRAAIKKHGKENFTKEIIANYQTRKEASDHEKRFVTLELIKLEECYNCRTGGDNEYTFNISDDAKLKMSNSRKGKTATKETKTKLSKLRTGDKNNFFGKTHTIQTKLKISNTKKGQVPPNLGKPMPEGQRKVLRETHPNRKPCLVGDLQFSSISECAKFFKTIKTTVLYRIQSKGLKWSDWKYITK